MGNAVIYIPTNDVEKPQQRCVLYFGNQRSVVFERIYEEYDWLIKELTNTDDEATYGNKAVIDTLVNFTDDLVIEAILNNADRVDNRGFGIVADQSNNVYVPFLSKNDRYFAAVCKNRAIYSQDDQINIAFSLSDITINGVTTSYSQETLTYNPSVAIGGAKSYTGEFYYRVSSAQLNTSGTAKYGNFVFKKGNSVIMNLTPCRLLQSIPAILDGNGIARPAGTCGMWDKVSNRFYGNVANSGTFTVKNPRCYEEYKWLKGRDGAYINTLHKLVPCDDVFECHFKWNGETTNPNGKTQGVFGCYFYQGDNCWTRVAIAYDLFYVNYFKLVNWNTIPINGVYDVEIKSLMSSSDSGNYSFTLNGVTHEYSNNGLANTETNADVLLFENIANNGTYFHGDIAYFKITDTSSNVKMHLIPCKLTHGIPASMDANGIARPAGTCGMWDKVNDKFYGNVASSGTFTVSND